MVHRSRQFIAILIWACAAFLALLPPAWAWDSKVEGGPGGGPFRIQCPGGSFMTGFEGRTGAYIDHFRILCGSWDANTRQVQNRGPLQITIGTSGGGGPAGAACPGGWAVNAINFQNTWRSESHINNGFVHHINFHCVLPERAESIWRTYGPTTPVPKPSGFLGTMMLLEYDQTCPNGELAVGFQGRSGLYVDALGLVCLPIPAAAPPPPVSLSQPNSTVLQPNRGSAAKGAILGQNTPGTPPPPAAPPPPLPNVATNQPQPPHSGFTGTWSSQTDKGWSYTITFIQDRNNVSGSYVAQNGAKGRITGRMHDNVLEFSWTQDGGFRGTGQFALSPDGNSFSGVYRSEPNKQISDPRYLQGSWNGTRR